MYPQIFKNLSYIVTLLIQRFKISVPKAKTGRPRKLLLINALVFALYQHRSTRLTKKSVYEDFKQTIRCSYNRFVVAINEVSQIAMKILFILMRLSKKNSDLIKYTDSTDIPVCLRKNGKRHKTMRGIAKWGHSGKGFHLGLKMTITRDSGGRMLAIRFNSANTDDRKIFKEINQDIYGIIVADAGCVSKKLEKEMNIENKRWSLFKPLKSMKKLATDWQLNLYNKRFDIEFDFRNFKMFHGLVTSLPRSVNGYLANYIHSLLSFVLS